MSRTFEFWCGKDEEPTCLGEGEGETFREACQFFFEGNPDFNVKLLFFQGLHVYENKEEAQANYDYRHSVERV